MSSSLSASSSRSISVARSDAPSSCSSVRGPMIGAVTPFCASSHASATAAGSSPSSVAEGFPLRDLRSDRLVARVQVLAPSRGLPLQHPAEHAAGERAPGDHREAVRAARREHFELHRARREVVEALLAHEAEEVAVLRRLVRLRDVPAREVAAPDIDDLARVDEVLHRLPHLVPRRGTVDVMHLVEVDVVGLQSTQARVACVADVSRRETAVVGPVRHRAEHLRREHHLLASIPTLREPSADDRLGRARALVAAVAVCRVEEVDAVLEGTVHDDAGVVLARERTEVHGAEAQLADAQGRASESAVLHLVLPCSRSACVRPYARHAAPTARDPYLPPGVNGG